MATKYLDTTGLQYLWSKIKTWAKRVLVSSISYDGDVKAIKMTKYDGTNDTEHTTQIVSAATIVSDGGGITSHQDISGKADKVSGATNGNFASLNSSGNLVDSGHKHSDYLTEHQDISGKANKSEMSVVSGTGLNGVDTGKTAITLKTGTTATVLNTHQDISGKADKVKGATNGNIPKLDDKGNLVDSGFTLGKSVPSNAIFTDTKDTTGIGSIMYAPEFDTLVDGATDIKKECYVPFYLLSLSEEEKEFDHGSIGMTLTGSDVLKIDTTVSKESNEITIGQTDLYIGGEKAVTDHNTIIMTNKTLTSPTLTGIPVAPTASEGTNTTQIATTAFVTSAISTASGSYVSSSSVGVASGVCPLDANTKIDSQYLPSYVDDVIEAYARTGQTALSSTWLATGSASGTVITPESGKIYVLMADTTDYSANTQFRWSGTTYVKLNDGGVSAITNAEIDSITNN